MKPAQEDLLIELLQTEWQFLNTSIETLLLSVEKCKAIGLKPAFSFEEQESFDSLTSKFNRTSDLFTQKILRTSWMLLHESFVPFIDMMNMCEKMHLIHSADQMITIRDMRNQIAHEYLPKGLHDLVPEVIEMTEKLVENIEASKLFFTERRWIDTCEWSNH
ncbi:hypothetical protein [Microbacter margulisiae]|uniref:Uncharacterized protein n=1 Tax=Microbacter margulisiae TaxID=1350067 RepID=A0A7W5DQR3_9PORP|nr:hypothetical protein [Microbacter margulisiae]MBB3187231.1 hypothetical protein [Microbacter margulisiae]